jgi:prepilin-type N-terminal cleavage/methylation domain-containing protein
MIRVTSRRGVSLVEVVVALTILAVGLLGLAGLTARASRHASTVGNTSLLSNTVIQQVNRLSVLPYDSLALGTTCKDMSVNGFDYERCVRVDSLQQRLKQITLTITPDNSAIRPVTEVFQRSKPPTTNVMNRY